MKIGDRVCCIENFNLNVAPSVFFYKNETYTITNIKTIDMGDNGLSDICEIDHKLNFYIIKNTYTSWVYFNDYFITIKEQRKDKLKKIHECNL